MADLNLSSDPPPAILNDRDFPRLLNQLEVRGYTVLGPTIRDGAVIYDRLASVEDLPRGWSEIQEGGAYRLVRQDDGTWFGYTVGANSWKRFLHPTERRLWSAEKTNGDGRFEIRTDDEDPPQQAFVGVRACELAAIAVQDRVLMEGPFADPEYKARRERAFIVAINCGRAASTCFCTSMGTGPQATRGFDMALTELTDQGFHRFLVQAGSFAGEMILAELMLETAATVDLEAAARVVEETGAAIHRLLDTDGLHDLLLDNPEHPEWKNVAERCLSCGNCTLVCPTCFCSTVEDRTDLSGDVAERWQKWDSCFSLDFSYIHGGSVRSSASARYRQWMTHKLATWIDQFGTSGCVGCGRCITWCPVGIDIVDIAGRIRATSETPVAVSTPDQNGGPR